MDPRPTVMLGGAPKSGTTTLYYQLSLHPDVFAPALKEPSYFAFADHPPRFCGPGDEHFATETTGSIDEYVALYAPGASHAHRLDGSSLYLSQPGTAQRIYQELPDARMIFVLRDPIFRAYAAYNQMRRDGREPLPSFQEALGAEPRRAVQGWSPAFQYAGLGMYGRSLRDYYDIFGPDQVLVLVYEDLIAGQARLLHRVEQYLALAAYADYPSDVRFNLSGQPRSPQLHRLLHRRSRVRRTLKALLPPAAQRLLWAARTANLRSPPQLDPDAIGSLASALREDTAEAVRLAGLDVTGKWVGFS